MSFFDKLKDVTTGLSVIKW